MANATFNANLTFTPPASNTVSQAFSLKFSHSAVAIGTVDVDADSEAAATIPIESGKSTRGVIVRNNLDVNVNMDINGNAELYELAPGGMFMHWSPENATTTDLDSITLTPVAKTTKAGTIEYVVLVD